MLVHCRHSPLKRSGQRVGPHPSTGTCLLWTCCLADEPSAFRWARPKGTWKPSLWPDPAGLICCCFGGTWTSKMKTLSVPAWSWMILASHIFPCFSSKTRFHKWSCNFVYLLAPQLSNFAAWIHSYCEIYNTPCKVGIDPWTNPSHVNFMPWHPGRAHSLKSNPFRVFSETSSEKSTYAVVMTKTLSGATSPLRPFLLKWKGGDFLSNHVHIGVFW